MDATLHSIEGRARDNEIEPAAMGHFRLGPARPVSSRIAVEEPGWTPYCLDSHARTALFVDVGPEVDLAEAVFVNPVQFHAARRALKVPFHALEDLARRAAAPERVILIYNIGRCGTTLVNAMLNEIDGVWSLSEPDVYFELMMQRATLDRGEVQRLIAACTRLLFRPPARRQARTLAVKFRAGTLFQADVYRAALPHAACVFMYRDGLSWARSFHYFMRNLGVPPVLDPDTRRFIWWIMSAAADVDILKPYVDMAGEEVYPEQLLAPAWALSMEEYLRQFEGGVAFLALRYDELVADRPGATARLLRHCGLPAEAISAAFRAFERDSQAGTAIARGQREESFTGENQARFLATLARHPRIASPDLLLPDVDHPRRLMTRKAASPERFAGPRTAPTTAPHGEDQVGE